MKCKICNKEITEENMISEDVKDYLCERADFYGMESLQENEQLYIETDAVCCNCL